MESCGNLDGKPELHKHVLHLAQQAAALRLVFDRVHSFQLFQQLTLPFAQLGGSLHSNLDEQIPFATPIEYRHAFVPDAKRGSRLRAFGNFQLVFSLQRRNHNLDAEGSLREALLARLERYIVADDVAVEDATETYALLHYIGAEPPVVAGIGQRAVARREIRCITS